MVFLRGQKMLGPRPDRSPLGVSFKFSNEHPHPFHMRGPPGVQSHLALCILHSAFCKIPLPLLSWDEFAAAFEQLCTTEHNNIKVLLCYNISLLWWKTYAWSSVPFSTSFRYFITIFYLVQRCKAVQQLLQIHPRSQCKQKLFCS